MFKVVLLLLAVAIVANAAHLSATHLLLGESGATRIRGIDEVSTAGGFTVFETDNTTYRHIPNPTLAGGSVKGVQVLGSDVLLYGTFTSVIGQATTGLALWNAAASEWCVPQELQFYNFDVNQMVASNVTYSCIRDGTTRGLTFPVTGASTLYNRLPSEPCGTYPLASSAVTAGNIQNVFYDTSGAQAYLYFAGQYNQVNQERANVGGFSAATYDESTHTFTFLSPGYPAIATNNGFLSGTSGASNGVAGAFRYRSVNFNVAGGGIGLGYQFDREVANSNFVGLPRSTGGFVHNSPCVQRAVLVVNSNRVFLCLSGGNLYRMIVPTAINSVPFNFGSGRNGDSPGIYWQAMNGNSSAIGIPANAINDFAVKPGTNEVYVVGNWDTTFWGVYHNGGVSAALIPPEPVRSRHIAQLTNVGSLVFTALGLDATTGTTDAELTNLAYQIGNLNDTDARNRGWNNFRTHGQGAAAWNQGTNNAGLGFDTIAFASATDLYVAGGYRVASGTDSMNKVTNIYAGQLQLRVLQINEASRSITPVGELFGPFPTGTGTSVAGIQRPSVTRVASGSGIQGLHYHGDTLYLFGNTNTRISRYGFQISQDEGVFLDRRFTHHFDFSAAKFSENAWVPALGGGWENRGSEALAWANNALYVYTGNDRAYNTYAGGVLYYNTNDGAWGNGLSNIRVLQRSNTAGWGVNGANPNGNNGDLLTAHFFDEANGARQAIVAGTFDWIGTVQAGSVALVDLSGNGTAATAIGTGLYKVNNAAFTSAYTRNTNPLKYVAAGTVNAVLSRKSGANAGNWVVAGGDFDAANLSGGDRTLRTSCVNNFAIYSSLDNEAEAYSGKWNQLNYGCNGDVNVLYHYGGYLYVGGSFDQCGLYPTGGVARIRMNIGQTVESLVTGNHQFKALGLGVTGGNVNSIVEFNDRIYIAGTFGEAGGIKISGGIASWEYDDDDDSEGDWEDVAGDCYQECDKRRDANSYPYHMGVATQDPELRRPSTINGESFLYAHRGAIYVSTANSAGTSLLQYRRGNWFNLGTVAASATRTAGDYQPAIAWNRKENNLIVIGTGVNAEYKDGQGAGYDEFSLFDDDYISTYNGFLGGRPYFISSASSATVSAVLMAVAFAAALLF